MKKQFITAFVSVCLATIIWGCGGGGSSIPSLITKAPPKTTEVEFVIHQTQQPNLASNPSTFSDKVVAFLTGATPAEAYLPQDVLSVTIATDGGTPVDVNIVPGQGTCTAASGNPPTFSCTAFVPVTPGTHNFVLVGYSAINAGGQKLTYAGLTNIVISPNVANVVNVTMAGIVAQQQVAFDATTYPLNAMADSGCGTAYANGATQYAKINYEAMDATGDFIIGQFDQASGAPATISQTGSTDNPSEVCVGYNVQPWDGGNVVATETASNAWSCVGTNNCGGNPSGSAGPMANNYLYYLAYLGNVGTAGSHIQVSESAVGVATVNASALIANAFTANPASLTFLAPGQQTSVSATNSGATMTVSDGTPSCAGIATWSPSSGPDPFNFTVTAVAAGSCSINVTDNYGQSLSIPISVTTTQFIIQNNHHHKV